MADEKQIIEEIADSLALPVADIDTEAHLQDDLGLNPVALADLYESLSHKFNIIFETAELERVKTVGDLVELIEDKMLE